MSRGRDVWGRPGSFYHSNKEMFPSFANEASRPIQNLCTHAHRVDVCPLTDTDVILFDGDVLPARIRTDKRGYERTYASTSRTYACSHTHTRARLHKHESACARLKSSCKLSLTAREPVQPFITSLQYSEPRY